MTKKELNKDNIQKLKKQFANEKANIQKYFVRTAKKILYLLLKKRFSYSHSIITNS